MKEDFVIAPEVAEAIEANAAVVALETAVVTHGLPAPHNLKAAHAMETAVREAGAVPATTGIIGGRIHVGLDEGQLARLADGGAAAKASRRDLANLMAAGGEGGTTVAAAVFCAAVAGIKIFATGGIGGVHRGAETTFDVSADLAEIAHQPVAVVCSGAKSILDIPRTLEVLETHGVPVAGYGIGHFAGFHTRETELALDVRLDSAEQGAHLIRTHLRLGGGGGLVIANPVPPTAEIRAGDLKTWIEIALAEAEAGGVTGKAVTPFLLDRLMHLSGGRTLTANLALLQSNARLAGDIAAALSEG
jgi:pseudouridine-5'-phosphate glycosidase